MDQAPPALDPNSRLFVVSNTLQVATAEGEECALTPGDVIFRTGDIAGDDNKIATLVKSCQRADCRSGSSVLVDVSDLQEMHNHLRQLMDEGLQALANTSGTHGLPPAPDATVLAGEVPAPAADGTVETDLQTQQNDADQIERELPQGSGKY